MSEPEHRSPYSPRDQAAGEGHGLLNETQELFVRLTEEVAQRSRLEREDDRTRGPVARVFLVLTIAAVLLAAATMVYGIYHFPDAPIRKTAHGYAGKGRKPRTQEEFAAFIAWEKALLVVFPSAFVLGFSYAITDMGWRRKGPP
jgi:hypothetical protein